MNHKPLCLNHPLLENHQHINFPLADALLADLEEGGEEEERDDAGDTEDVDEIKDVTMDVDTDQKSVKSIAKLRDSEELQEILTQIEYFSKSKEKRTGKSLNL